MTNEEILLVIKEIRNVFDTLGVECDLASRFSMDTWAAVLQGEDGKLHCINFHKNILHRVSALRSLLYSIEVKAKQIGDAVCGEPSEMNIKFEEQPTC